ncbi:MAG: caspase family protein [Thainema sp.]
MTSPLHWNRRRFLQAAGATAAALGWNQLDIWRQGQAARRVLAQTAPRKLALLVGINDYPASSGMAPLDGCVNDVEMQYHLLVHRFGFDANNIVKLTDGQATRDRILSTFDSHLIQQAQPGDVVVFHFSGHGSQVLDPDRDNVDGLNSTLVPVDSPLPSGYPREGGSVRDITGHTLFLLMSAIQTENLTVVLDSCYSGGGTRGNFKVRSRSGGSALQMSQEELDYQQQLLARLNMTPDEFIQKRRAGVAKGVAIASTKRDQLAADAAFDDFYAGAFTYTFTQYLWQQPGNEPFSQAIPNVARSTHAISFTAQEPLLEVAPNSQGSQKSVFFVQKQAPPAEAVITQVNGNQAEVWFGGLNPDSLVAFRQGALLSAVDQYGNEQGLLQLESRNGLVGQGQLLDAVQPGALLQERARGIPSDISLQIGLHDSLGADYSTAQQALAALPRIEPKALQAGEVQYIFGKMTADLAAFTGTYRPEMNSFGLFSAGLEPMPDSFGAAGESVTGAVQRLQAKLRSLLAARLVKLTLNTNSSRLNVSVDMQSESGSQLWASLVTTRSSKTAPPAIPGITQIPVGTSLQFEVQNREARDLYLSVLTIDAAGELTVIYPVQWTTGDAAMLLPAGQTLRIPDLTRDRFQIVTQPPIGLTEVLVLASNTPLTNTLLALRNLANQLNQVSGPIALARGAGTEADAVGVIEGLLSDVNQVAQPFGGVSRQTNAQTIDTTQLAAMSLTFDVV